jgi:hypothetical protein
MAVTKSFDIVHHFKLKDSTFRRLNLPPSSNEIDKLENLRWLFRYKRQISSPGRHHLRNLWPSEPQIMENIQNVTPVIVCRH